MAPKHAGLKRPRSESEATHCEVPLERADLESSGRQRRSNHTNSRAVILPSFSEMREEGFGIPPPTVLLLSATAASVASPDPHATPTALFSAATTPSLPLPRIGSSQTAEVIQSLRSHMIGLASKQEWRAGLERLRTLRTTNPDKFKKGLAWLADCIDLGCITVEDMLSILDRYVLRWVHVSPAQSKAPLSDMLRSFFGQKPSKSSILNHLSKLGSKDEWTRAIGALEHLPVVEKDEEGFELMIKLIKNAKSLKQLIEYSEGLLEAVTLPTYSNTIEDHVRKRSEIKSEFMIALFGPSWATTHSKRIMVGPILLKEISRAVAATQVVIKTETISALSRKLEGEHAVVLTGESGSGKTVASMLGSTLKEKHFAVYLGAAEQFNFESPANKPVERDAELSRYLEGRIAESTGHRVDVGDDFDHSEGAVLTIIFDELGSFHEVRRSYIRLAWKSDSDEWRKKIKKSFGVDVLRFVAVGTGCDDTIFPAGSLPDSYTTVFTTSHDGHAVWRHLVMLQEGSLPWSYVCALAGGLEVDSVVSKDLLHEVESHPEGFVSAGTGRALVGNARMAALLASQISQLAQRAPKEGSAPVLIEAALAHIASLHLRSVDAFVARNGLARYEDDHRMQLVAEALALTLASADGDIPQEMFHRLCTKAGVLTSHGIAIGNSDTPMSSRVINTKPGHVGQRVAIEDRGRRYRVTEAMAVMYLTHFGAARRPARTGETFELCVLDYVKVALVPASIVAEWSRDRQSPPPLKCLSDPSRSVIERCALFDLLVEAFVTAGVSAGKVLVFQLPSKFEPGACNDNAETSESSARIKTLSDIWKLLEAKAKLKEGVTVAVVLNADKASGADVMVLCHGHFAIHLAIKSHQQTCVSVDALMDEYRKTGAFRGTKASKCIASTSGDFPTHYHAIVRCAETDTLMDTPMQEKLKKGRRTSCRYIEVQAGTDVFYPLVLVSNVKTKPALSSISTFTREPLPIKGSL